MIKLLILLSLFIPLLSEERVFLLPDHHTLFAFELTRLCKKSSMIRIIAPSFNHSALKKGILTGAKKGSQVTLVVNDPHGDPLSMVQYQGVDLYNYSHPLKQSIFMINDHFVCTLNGNIDQETFESNKRLIRCSDDPNKIGPIKHALEPILRQAKPYLE